MLIGLIPNQKLHLYKTICKIIISVPVVYVCILLHVLTNTSAPVCLKHVTRTAIQSKMH